MSLKWLEALLKLPIFLVLILLGLTLALIWATFALFEDWCRKMALGCFKQKNHLVFRYRFKRNVWVTILYWPANLLLIASFWVTWGEHLIFKAAKLGFIYLFDKNHLILKSLKEN